MAARKVHGGGPKLSGPKQVDRQSGTNACRPSAFSETRVAAAPPGFVQQQAPQRACADALPASTITGPASLRVVDELPRNESLD
jgi:hypothetical protein